MGTVCVLGGHGNFGRRISAELSGRPGLSVRVAGRDASAGSKFADSIGATFHLCDLREPAQLRGAIEGAQVVVDAAGPFQNRDYAVARQCIEMGIHCIDLADARGYVTGIEALDAQAAERQTMVASGASSVPAVTSAMIDRLTPQFGRISDISAALTSGNRHPRGPATLAAALASVGRPFNITMNGREKTVHGWSDGRRIEFPRPVGTREGYLLDVPDVALFPARYDAANVRFHGGVELTLFHRVLSGVSWLRRHVLDLDLSRWGHFMGAASHLLGRVGTSNGCLAVWIRGTDPAGRPLQRRLALVTDRDGPATPCAPAVLLAERILTQGPPRIGAFPCVSLLTFEELVDWLRPHGVWPVHGDAYEWTVNQ